MKVDKFEEKKNELLGRKEVLGYLVFDGATPKREDVKKAMCEKVGANPDMSILRELNTEYGLKRISAILHVYEDAEKMKEMENKYLLKRDGLIKEEKKDEAPKEEKPPEKK